MLLVAAAHVMAAPAGKLRPGRSRLRPRAIDAARGIDRLEAANAQAGSLLAYGNGRSYGDSCQNANGTLIDMRAMDRILGFDPETGIVEAEAGTLLSDIIAYAAPHGFFPPVVPGTQFVTLGGAIANDVHGKNHHRRGTFGRHVECSDAAALRRHNGIDCSPSRQCTAVRRDDRRHGADRADPVAHRSA